MHDGVYDGLEAALCAGPRSAVHHQQQSYESAQAEIRNRKTEIGEFGAGRPSFGGWRPRGEALGPPKKWQRMRCVAQSLSASRGRRNERRRAKREGKKWRCRAPGRWQTSRLDVLKFSLIEGVM